MEAALIAKLLASAGVTALVSTRINWDRRPQGEPVPAIVLYVISGPRDYHMAGASGLVVNRVQADCLGASKKEAKQVADALEAVISGARFVQGATRFDGVFVIGDGSSSYDDAGVARFRQRLDLEVHHARAA